MALTINPAATPLPSRVDSHEKALEAVVDILSGRPGSARDVGVSTRTSELSRSVHADMQKADALHFANAMLGQADHLLAQAAELEISAGNGALSETDRSIVRNQQQQLITDARSTIEHASFSGQNALTLAGNLAGFDPSAFLASFDQDENLADTRDLLGVARGSLAASENGMLAKARTAEQESASLAAGSTGEDLAAVLSRLSAAEVDTSIANRVFNLRQLGEDAVLKLLSG